MQIIDQIRGLAGMRAETMAAAAEHFLVAGGKRIAETGCFRGSPVDGNSTLVWALLAHHACGTLVSYDNNPAHIALAMELLREYSPDLLQLTTFIEADSVGALSSSAAEIDLLYLDSFDYAESDPLPCQLHQLAELGAAWGKLRPGAGVLLDDYALPQEGKCRLSAQFLRQRGGTLVGAGYQIFFRLP